MTLKMGVPPVEKYRIKDTIVNVVREDLTSAFPAPNNAKTRGIYKKIEALHEQGVKAIASQDTRISRIGWGISWICHEFDMKHYNFYPATVGFGKDYSKAPLPFYQRMSKYWGGEVIPVHGTFASAFKVACERELVKRKVDNAWYMPIGASLDETILEISELVSLLPSDLFQGTIVTNISSGTMCAGLTYGCKLNNYKTEIRGVQGSGFKNRREKILNKIAHVTGEKIDFPNLQLFDPGYKYTQKELTRPPFPCDLYLDRKAWKWLVDHIEELPQPVTMYNIGGEWDPMNGLIGDLRGDGRVKPYEIYNLVGPYHQDEIKDLEVTDDDLKVV